VKVDIKGQDAIAGAKKAVQLYEPVCLSIEPAWEQESMFDGSELDGPDVEPEQMTVDGFDESLPDYEKGDGDAGVDAADDPRPPVETPAEEQEDADA